MHENKISQKAIWNWPPLLCIMYWCSQLIDKTHVDDNHFDLIQKLESIFFLIIIMTDLNLVVCK